MSLGRSLPQAWGVLRPVRGILPGLKGPGAKRRVKKGPADVGRGPSLGLGCGGGTGTFTWRKALVSGRAGD